MKHILFLCLALLTLSCTHPTAVHNLDTWNEKNGESLSLSLRTIKERKNYVHLSVLVRNSYPYTIVISENAFRYERNGDIGVGGENDQWVLKAGDVKTAMVKFKLAREESADAVLTLDHIYKGDAFDIKGNKTEVDAAAIGRGKYEDRTVLGRAESKTENYQRKGYQEGQQLSKAVLRIPAGTFVPD